MDDLIVPKSVFAIEPIKSLNGMQKCVRISVELQDGSILRLAFPEACILLYQIEKEDSPCR